MRNLSVSVIFFKIYFCEAKISLLDGTRPTPFERNFIRLHPVRPLQEFCTFLVSSFKEVAASIVSCYTPLCK
jgi:hypothetical protein